jgi:hemerythrin
MEKTVSQIMMRDHSKIHNLISEIELKSITNQKDSQHLFIKLKWTIEKHFFVEEKVIFTLYSSNYEENDYLDKLLKEHKEILFLINKIDNNFKNSKELLQELKLTINAHAKYEDDFFYPELEEKLSKNEKDLIKDRCEKWD